MDHRERLRVRFLAACSTNSSIGWAELPKKTQNQITAELERGCYNLTIKLAESAGIYCNFDNPAFVSQYSLICDRVGSHIDTTSAIGQTDLLTRILKGDINPAEVAMMKSEELWPPASADLREELAYRSRQSITPKTSQRYKCRMCGYTETSVREYQSRAGDESSTTSIMCMREGCGHTWRVN